MRRHISLGLGFALIAIGLIVAPARAATVNIPDTNLRSCLTSALGKPSGYLIQDTDLLTLTSLSCNHKSIVNLEGLQYATNLTSLDLQDNVITDVSRLHALTKLVYVTLWRNDVRTGLGQLASLPNLVAIDLTQNPAVNVNELGTLTQLHSLTVDSAGLTDLTPLANLTELRVLLVRFNSITSVAPLASLTHLQQLHLYGNQISDLGPLHGLSELKVLSMEHNEVTELSALRGLDNLQAINAAHNRISSVAPLAQLPALTRLELSNNRISDLGALSGNTALAANTCSSTNGGDTGMCALNQTVSLPDAAVGSGYSFVVKDSAAAMVPLTPASGVQYADGVLTYPAAGSYQHSFTAALGGAPVFTGTVSQTARITVLEGRLAVTGAAVVGQALTASATALTPAPVSVGYQWLRGDSPIPGATTASYLLTPDDVGAAVRVRVRLTKPLYTDVVWQSTPVTVAKGTLTAGVPTISGTAVVGNTLSGTSSEWGPAPVTLSYQWLRNGVPVVGAIGPSYELTTADLGATLALRVTGTKPGYETAIATSAATSPVSLSAWTATPRPRIKGQPKLGRTLRAVLGVWVPSPTVVSYQWLRGGKPVRRAVKARYRLTKKDLGKRIAVRVTLGRPGYPSIVVTAKPTRRIRRPAGRDAARCLGDPVRREVGCRALE